MQYSHYSPLNNKPDLPENYHIITITLSEFELHVGVEVELMQDNNNNNNNNNTEDEQRHSEENWNMMLEGLKTFLEK